MIRKERAYLTGLNIILAEREKSLAERVKQINDWSGAAPCNISCNTGLVFRYAAPDSRFPFGDHFKDSGVLNLVVGQMINSPDTLPENWYCKTKTTKYQPVLQ